MLSSSLLVGSHFYFRSNPGAISKLWMRGSHDSPFIPIIMPMVLILPGIVGDINTTDMALERIVLWHMKQYDAISLVTMTTLEVTSHDLIYRYILVWKICGVQSGNSWGSERWRVSPLHYNVINHMSCFASSSHNNVRWHFYMALLSYCYTVAIT